jgi:hypothetical protein
MMMDTSAAVQAADARHAIEAARRLVDDAGAEPPVDMLVLAWMRGIARVSEVDQPWAGMLVPIKGQLVVHVRESDGLGRQRFTVGHEIGHTFDPAFERSRHYRCNPATAKTRIETLSDLVATELLFPARQFKADLATAGLTTEGIEWLAHRYITSLEAAALRAVDLWPRPALLLVLAENQKPTEVGTAAEPKLRLQYGHASGEWPYLLRHKSADANSPFARAHAGEAVDGVFELGPLSSSPVGAVRISARAYGAKRRVLAVVERAA